MTGDARAQVAGAIRAVASIRSRPADTAHQPARDVVAIDASAKREHAA